jgi:A/G-specific adenine glycosylase
MMTLSATLLNWYDKHCRSLPWRGEREAYKIWVSEVILQQTQIERGILYYHRFLEAFPNIYALADASEDEVLRIWQGLGYYSRARNMHHTARSIVKNNGGSFPSESVALKKLRGIGSYTAAAIASIAFNEKVPAIDGNVYRVLARLFAMPHNIDVSSGKKAFQELADKLIPVKRPGEFNQALMDFGSLVCKPVNPMCNDCIFQDQCLAFQQKTVHNHPVRNVKREARKRYFNYFFVDILQRNKKPAFFVQKRIAHDIWKNMYELPLLETESILSEEEVLAHPAWKDLFLDNAGVRVMGADPLQIHQLTHQRIYARLFRVKVIPGYEEELKKKFILVDADRFNQLAKPRLIEKLMKHSEPHR